MLFSQTLQCPCQGASWAPPPYPEELKLEEFIAALELLWAVPGLLAWSALPGEEGLLEFPGEHDDVTV